MENVKMQDLLRRSLSKVITLVFTIFLGLVVIYSLDSPKIVSAVTTNTWSDEQGNSVDWSFEEDTGILTIGREQEKQKLPETSNRPNWESRISDYGIAITKIVFVGEVEANKNSSYLFKNYFKNTEKDCSIDLTNLSVDEVENMEGMFYACSGLEELDLSHFNTSRVKNMSWMFNSCTSLKELDLTNFNTSEVQTMSWMFCQCSSL
ncbi:MAG: DUF285 domain-containing protein, partial [Clostridioides sp.]|nr:DUF285 domain-containing protein [Clostridioides sp.]